MASDHKTNDSSGAWITTHDDEEKALRHAPVGGRVFMLEFRISMPIDIPRAHVALLFDFAGSCRTNKQGHLTVIAGTLAHIVVENVKTRKTKLEIRPVSSITKDTFINPKTISRVYLLGRIMRYPMDQNPSGGIVDLITHELQEIYYSMIESEDEVSEGELSIVRRSEYEEKRHFDNPNKSIEPTADTPASSSLTDSGNILWRVSNSSGGDMCLSPDAVQEKPPTLKDSNQSIILGYLPSQRDSLPSEPLLRNSYQSSDGISVDLTTAHSRSMTSGSTHTSPRSYRDSHGPYWDSHVNCLTFCKRSCYHWSDLKWPEEGLCAPILWPLSSLNIHLALGYPEQHSVLVASDAEALAEHRHATKNDKASRKSLDHPNRSAIDDDPPQFHPQRHSSEVDIPVALPADGISPANPHSSNIFKRAFRSTKRSWRNLFGSKDQQ